MSTARSAAENAPDPAGLAAALREAPFVRLRVRADGDALAAGALLARALRRRGAAFHARVRADPAAFDADGGGDADPDGDAPTVVVGATGRLAVPGREAGRPASATAFEVARELGHEPDPVLALAGAVAAGATVGADGTGTALDAAESRSLVERRPGVAVPTADLVDGLAHSTLLRAPFSGDPEATGAALAEASLPAELDADAHRRLASLVALAVTGADGASPRAAESVERALRPYATPAGPFETLGGHADVLDAAARERPGVGLALALDGGGDPTAALDAWRAHARAVHRALDAARIARHGGLVVARVDADAADLGGGPAPLSTAARLLRDFASPEPTALVVADAGAAAASVDAGGDPGVGRALADAAAEVGGRGYGTAERGEARFDADERTDEERFIAAVREAL